MNTLLYFKSRLKTSTPGKLLGVREHANAKGWHVQVVEVPPTKKAVNELAAFWNPIGAVIDCGGGEYGVHENNFGSIPAVFLDCNPDDFNCNVNMVCHDSTATGTLAAKELMLLGRTHFAYVPFPGSFRWCSERYTAFKKALAINGFNCSLFSHADKTFTLRRQRRLTEFLLQLPKPCSIFAANDRTAEEISAAATFSDLSIPGDIALLGADNFLEICENTAPNLSSIEPDFRQGGILSALLLESVIHSKNTAKTQCLTFGPLQTIRRRSTTTVSSNKTVTDALALISDMACGGLTAADVVKLFNCSRRAAEIQFRKATGKSILNVIHETRLERTKVLLTNPYQQLKSMSDFCGFKSQNSLRRFFRKQTGMTLSSWQKSIASKSSMRGGRTANAKKDRPPR